MSGRIRHASVAAADPNTNPVSTLRESPTTFRVMLPISGDLKMMSLECLIDGNVEGRPECLSLPIAPHFLGVIARCTVCLSP